MNLQLTEKNQMFRNALINTVPIISAERAQIVTKIYQENEHLSPIAKAALGLKAVLEQMTIEIQDWDLIAGNQADGLRASTINPAVNTWIVDELDKFELRDGSRFHISEETKESIRKIIPYWKNKNVYEKTMALLPEDTTNAMDSLVFTCGYTLSKGCGHWLVNMERVLKEGFAGIEAQARSLRNTCDLSDPDGIDKIPFYDAVIIVCQAVRDFALRYRALALEKAQSADEQRKKELLAIAEICDKIPYQAPSTYHEAIQTVFFLQLIPQIESDGTGISAGRLDMFLYPFYKRDMEAGRITKGQAEELTDQLWLKIASVIQVWNEEDSKSFGGHPISQAITLGGMDEQGNDNTNELSYLMLETTARVHMAQPSVCCRINRGTPDDFLSLCSEVIREGLGMPAMYNDEIAIPSLVSHGIPLDLARKYYAVIGCVEMGVQGKLCAFANSGYFNLAKTLEIMLHNGMDPATHKKLVTGTRQLEDITDFQSFTELYYDYMERLLKHQVRVTNAVDTMHARLVPLPFMSAITDGCIDSGKEVQSGGALYNYDGIQGVGLADVTDSFLAVKKLVFEEHFCTLPEFVAALDADYKGYDELWIRVRKEIVRYGNHSAEACSLRTFFLSGGYHIQFNVVSSETLRDAQKHPEQYRDLVVRVAGYTAFFTDLNKEIQNDIIDRTEMDFSA